MARRRAPVWLARLATLAGLLVAPTIAAQKPIADATIVNKSYRAAFDGTQQPYALAVPRDYSSQRSWPLLVALHGAFSRHDQNLQRVLGARAGLPVDPPMLVLAPLGRGELMSYDGLGEDDVLRAIAEVRRDYHVDPDRIYLTGLSMGGGGTWHLGLRYPDLFAALVPVCAVVDPRKWIEAGDRPLYDDALLELGMPTAIASNAVNQRVVIYHGDADDVVPVSDARRMVAAFKALGWMDGGRVRYFELPGVRHNAWDVAYQDGNVFRLLAGIRRDPFPEHVWYKTASLRYQKAYWARIDRIDHGGALAEIDAHQSNGTFTVRAQNISGFSLLLDPAFVAPSKTITVRMVNDRGPTEPPIFTGLPGPGGTVSFARDGARWRRVPAPVTGAPPEHAVVAMISRSLPRQSPHIYVYGSDGTADQVKATRALAQALADWGPGVRATFPIKSDRELTDAELRALNLVLIGDAATNRVVRRMANKLPLPLAATTATGDSAYRLVAGNPLAPGKHVLIFGAQTPAALQHLATRFAHHNNDAWAPEPNIDYLRFDPAGALLEARVFKD